MTKSSDADWRSLEQFSFGDNPELAGELARLVLAGTKRATCWAANEGPKTDAGKQWVVLDGSGVPVAVIETAPSGPTCCSIASASGLSRG
jgi:uncharacterized protein YhfF